MITTSDLKQAIERAARLLPTQGPITSFVALNTLQAFEDLPFDEAVRKAARILGCQGYLSEERFRLEFTRGQIRESELKAVLREDLGTRADEPVLNFGTRYDIRFTMLRHPLRMGPDAELRWFVAETDALRRIRPEATELVRNQFIQTTRQWITRDVRGVSGPNSKRHDPRVTTILGAPPTHLQDTPIESWNNDDWESYALQSLWRICRNGVRTVPQTHTPPTPRVRHRDYLKATTGEDSDRLIGDLLIPFCAAYLDQGFSHWHLPDRELGFFHSFCKLYGQAFRPASRWTRGLDREIQQVMQNGTSALDSVQASLEILGISEPELHDFLAETLLAMRGWAGMLNQIELRSESVAHPIAKGSLIDFLAVRLLLERFALASIGRAALGFNGPLSQLRQFAAERPGANGTNGVLTLEQRAFQVFQLAQVHGWLPRDLFHLTENEWSTLVTEIESFSSDERRRLFQIAYERRFQIQTLDAIAVQSQQSRERVPHARFQAVFCLDDREESFRRHLEEIAPDVETFGAAGFFNVPIYYRGVDHAHFVPLCPIVVKPQHWVVETASDRAERANIQRAKRRRALGAAAHKMHVGSRGIGLVALLTAGFGVLASIPLMARILFPRFTGRLRRSAGSYIRPPQETNLRIERQAEEASSAPGHIGFNVEEMTNNGERLLRDIGLVNEFSRIVLIVGHGSTSLNNPHKSAYDCGACGGGIGGPNARALAMMLNDPRVRAKLMERGLIIPNETIFIGGWHNTCNDSVELSDTHHIPPSHIAEFEVIRQNLEEACDRNAHERCRRFASAPLKLSFPAARRHVEGRSEDLAQTRPEYGHASTAICVVGRRSRTRGLFLDRRAFLTSYDPTQDDEVGSILARVLAAAIPVCGGISLCYYFSYVDNPGYGAGVKLPHNVTSLLGVMDGAASDLRTGLPWQGVEIHQPLRILFVIETTPEIMLRIMDQNPTIGRMCRNGWVQTTVISPDSSEIQVFQDGKFQPYQPQVHELPTMRSSVEWYAGLRDNLDFARIEP